MNGKTYNSNKKGKFMNKESFKENKNMNNINNIKTLNKNASKNSKAMFINNNNHIESINIINNNINYKNIIFQNLPTPNKQYTITGKDSTRNKKKLKIEKNLLFDNNNINNNFQTIVNKRQKSLNKYGTLRLMLNPSGQDNDDLNVNNDNEIRYKLKLYEKDNIINKLKDELEYYKNYYQSINPKSIKNITLPIHNTINTNDNLYFNGINKLSYGLEEKNKLLETENMRNKIKNIFSLRKNNINVFKTDNINNLKLNSEKEEETANNSKINKESSLSIKNKPQNRNKLMISNDILNLNKNTDNNRCASNSNIFYRSNSNTMKRKIKIGLQLSELNLENNKYNSIEANRNHMVCVKNKTNSIHSLNKNKIPKGLYDNENTTFNYIEKFENLKQRMNSLVSNLFELLEKNLNNNKN